METIRIWVEEMIGMTGLTGDVVPFVRHVVLALVAILLATLAGLVCRKLLVPVVRKLTARTEARWDDVLFNERVLVSACHIVPAIVVWQLLPLVFYQFPTVRELVTRATAIYITVMAVRTSFVFINSFRDLDEGRRSSRKQYFYSFMGVLKILMALIATIIVVSILIDRDPIKLFAGLGATSAVLMLVFQDTIKGLVAGIRLTSNDMLHVGDWITVPKAGANGIVEEMTLTTVKIRNFDNTIVTVTPQMLVDGAFQNWQGMIENEGRKQVKKVYYDFRSLKVDEDGVANITKFRQHIEQWLKEHPKVIGEKNPLVKLSEAPQPSGCCVEFVFWLYAQDLVTFEHDTSDIMEYIYAKGADYGLQIYQQVINNNQ